MRRDRDDQSGRKKFVYKKNDDKRSQFLKKSASSGAGYDNPIKSEYPVFLCNDGDFRIRILPATWEGAEGYDLETYVHYGVGVDNGRFLCPKKTEVDGKRGRECPVCDEYEKAKRSGDDDYANELRPAYRPLVWIINRDDEKTGPQVFPMPFTLKQEIAKRSVSKKTGAILYVDSPEEGHDIEFSRSSKGKKITYGGVEIDRDPTPLSDNPRQMEKWLDYIQENPLPNVLLLHDAEYIANVLGGGSPKKKGKAKGDEEDDEDEKPKTRSERRRPKDDEDDEEEESPRSKRRRDEEDEDDEEPAPKKKRKVIEADEDEIDDEDEELDEEDEDDDEPAPKKKRKPDPDEDESDEEDEEDEDERPARKSKSKPLADEDEDEEDDEPVKPRKKIKDEDPDDEEDEDSDDEEDEDSDDEEPDDDKPSARRPLKKRR